MPKFLSQEVSSPLSYLRLYPTSTQEGRFITCQRTLLQVRTGGVLVSRVFGDQRSCFLRLPQRFGQGGEWWEGSFSGATTGINFASFQRALVLLQYLWYSKLSKANPNSPEPSWITESEAIHLVAELFVVYSSTSIG